MRGQPSLIGCSHLLFSTSTVPSSTGTVLLYCTILDSIVVSSPHVGLSIEYSPTIHVWWRLFAIWSNDAYIYDVAYCFFADADSAIIVDLDHLIRSFVFGIEFFLISPRLSSTLSPTWYWCGMRLEFWRSCFRSRMYFQFASNTVLRMASLPTPVEQEWLDWLCGRLTFEQTWQQQGLLLKDLLHPHDPCPRFLECCPRFDESSQSLHWLEDFSF